MLSGRIHQRGILDIDWSDIPIEPNSALLALAWGLLLLVLGACVSLLGSNLTVRAIGGSVILSSSIPFLVFRKIVRKRGFAPKKYEPWPWPAYDFTRGPMPSWSSLDRVQKTGIVVAILVIVASVTFLLYVWLTQGF